MDPRARRRLEAETRASLLQVLFKCARLANERAIRRVNEAAGRAVFRQAIANLLPHIALDGTRLTDLARAVGVSKQAVSKVVAEMAAEGLVRLDADPTDARARLVRFTPRGLAAIRHGLGVLATVEEELAARVGRRRLDALGEGLGALLDALEALEAADATSSSA